MSRLRRSVRDLVERKTLSEERWAALEAMQQQAPSGPSEQRRPHARVAVAAALVLALLLPLTTWLAMTPGPPADIGRRIADEVTANHLRLKPMEVRTDSIAGIREYFSELDFLPIDSRLAQVSKLDMEGARYCSIQGATAAQLRFRAGAGEPMQTLYQTHYDPQRFGPIPNIGRGDAPLELRARGLTVSLWVEKGILLALIRE